MKSIFLLVLVAACTDATTGDLLSESRISVQELGGDTFVNVNAPPDHTFSTFAHLLDGTPVPELTVTSHSGPSLVIAANCNTAHGRDTTVLVDVHDDKDLREATLVVDVTNNASDACLANITIWKHCEGEEDCETKGACDDTTTAGDPLTLLSVATRGTEARFCVRVESVDEQHPIDGNDAQLEVLLGAPEDTEMPRKLETTAESTALDVTGGSGNTHMLAVHGQDWLVGAFTLTVTTSVDDLQIVRSSELTIGAVTDRGIELNGPTVAQEFARSEWDLHVHHFESPGCTFGFKEAQVGFTSLLTDDANVRIDPTTMTLPCTAAHPHFTLDLVPTISALDTVGAALEAEADNKVTITAKVQSVAEDLDACPSYMFQVTGDDAACADLDGDGTLEVVRTSDNTTNGCITEVTGAATSVVNWRKGAPMSLPVTTDELVDLVTLATSPPQIWAVDKKGALYRFSGPSGGFMWKPQFMSVTMGSVLVPYRRGAGPGPDTLASLVPGGIRFLALESSQTTPTVKTLMLPNAIAIGATRVGTGGASAGLVVVSHGTTETDYNVAVYPAPDLTQPTNQVPSSVPIASGVAHHMPAGESVTVEIAGRGPAQQDLVLVFYASEFASAVTEMQIANTALVVGDQYPAAGSVSATPDGDVLIGLAQGTKLSTGIKPSIKYILYDPVPPVDPSASYGRAVTPCLDYQGHMIGFAERANAGTRVAKSGIVPQTP